MARFHLNFSMVALYETRQSLATFEFCDGGVIQRIVFRDSSLYNETCQMARFNLNVTMVALYATRLSLRHLNFAMVALHRDLKFAIVLFYKET